MRTFNFNEQALVCKLIANSADPVACFPIKVLESTFQDNKVTFHNDEVPYFIFFVGEGKEDSVKELSKQFITKLMAAFNLFDYLKKEGLVTELDSGKDSRITYGDAAPYINAGLAEVRVYIEAELIAEQLVRFVNNSIYVSDALKELQNNEFKNFEDLSLAEYQKQTKKAKSAVILAFFAVLIAVAAIVLMSMGVLGDKAPVQDNISALNAPLEIIQGTLEKQILPAINDLKAEVTSVKTTVSELDAEPVDLSSLQKDDRDKKEAVKKAPSKKEETKKKGKSKKRH